MINEKAENSNLRIPPTTMSITIVLSIFAYLGRRGDYCILSRNSLFPYLLILAVMLVFRRIQRGISQLKNSVTTPKALKSLSSVSSSEARSRLSRVSSTETIRRLGNSIRSSLDSYRKRAALQAITRTECFARLDYIEQLSIRDVVVLFRYATDVNRVEFDKKRFVEQQNQLLRAMVTAIDMAVTISRGSLSKCAKLSGARREGEIDALHFVAVTRVLAEWRALRLVPKGFKRYAVGLNLGHRDLLQNLAKIEKGVHSYLKHCENLQASDEMAIPSPTLRQLLEHEDNANVHTRLPYLKDNSAASGLLWTKRQVHYQTSTFINSLNVPLHFSSPKDAAMAAYTEVYDTFHGWAIKQVFSHSFGGSPPLVKIWKAMDPPIRQPGDAPEQQHVLQRKLSEVSEESEVPDNEFLIALEDFGKHIGGKWDDFLGLFNCVSDEDKHKERARNLLMSSESYLDMTGFEQSKFDTIQEASSPQVDKSLRALDPIEEVKSGTADFVKEMQPLLSDLSGLIDEFNMNDPTRV
jgi:hypothetical protein